jgi:hypothetical protein
MAKLRSRLSESEERNAVCVILKVDVHFGDAFRHGTIPMRKVRGVEPAAMTNLPRPLIEVPAMSAVGK